jgi:hypothetical protein
MIGRESWTIGSTAAHAQDIRTRFQESLPTGST